MFVLISNLIGIIPYTFSVTSHIIVTAALALLVFFTWVIYGFYKHGLHFLKLFVPSGIPVYILPLVTFIEVLSFISRPISHSVRLFANMLAGHITLKVFAGFITMLAGFGIAGWVGALLPLALTVPLAWQSPPARKMTRSNQVPIPMADLMLDLRVDSEDEEATLERIQRGACGCGESFNV